MRRFIMPILALSLTLLFLASGSNVLSQEYKTGEIERIAPEEARQKVLAGTALLACAYDDETCKDILLESALLRGEFEAMASTFQKDQEIIFY